MNSSSEFVNKILGVQQVISDFSGEYEWLRNSHPCLIMYGGLAFPSVEHAYQAAKTKDKDIINQIIAADIKDVKRIGRKITDLPDDWDNIRLDVMKILVRQKFESSSVLRNKLIDTGTASISVVNNRDDFWGVTYDGGENHLGRILMEVRAEMVAIFGHKKTPRDFSESVDECLIILRNGEELSVFSNFIELMKASIVVCDSDFPTKEEITRLADAVNFIHDKIIDHDNDR